MGPADLSQGDISLHDAARDLGVALRVLRRAIRDGRVPAPAAAASSGVTAVSWVSPAWVDGVRAAEDATPGKIFTRARRQAVPAFARYQGTSAWKHNGRKPAPRTPVP